MELDSKTIVGMFIFLSSIQKNLLDSFICEFRFAWVIINEGGVEGLANNLEMSLGVFLTGHLFRAIYPAGKCKLWCPEL